MRSFVISQRNNGKAISLWIIAFPLFILLFACCRSNKPQLGDMQAEGEAGYSILTHDADILVSDSGITQYRIKAKTWYVYDSGEEPHWFFPNGFFTEQVDANLEQKAYLMSDTAYYYSVREEWLFIGHVKIQNRNNDIFLAKRMEWQKRNRMVFSNDTVTIHSGERTLQGVGFKANQDFTRYTFYNNSAIADLPHEENPSTE